MKKRLNLFSKKKQQQPIPTVAFTVRSYGLLFMCVCIFLSLVSGVWYYFQAQKLNELSEDVSRLQSQTRANDTIEGNIVFFVNKKEQLKTFLKDDANFELYYTILREAIVNSQTGAELISFSLNISRDTNFVIGFNDFSQSQRLLDYIETDAFLKNFDALVLRQFTINPSLPGQQNGSAFQLGFQGRFKEEKEEERNAEN